MRRAIVIALLLIAASCREKNTSFRQSGTFAKDEQAVRAQPASLAQGVSNIPSPPPPPPQRADSFARMIIRTATLSMVVDDTATSMDKVTAAAEAAGGYVSDSRVWRDGELLRGTISLRVPSTKLSATLAAIRKLAVRIQSESIGSQEVTQEYVDLESQLRNMEAAEVELRQLMTTMREKSKHASEVLEIYQQLASMRGQIEQTKGRMRYLSEMTAMATVNVELVPNAIARPVVEPGWQPLVVVRDASRALVNAMQKFASAAIWIAIYLLPIVALMAIALFATWKLAVRLVKRAQSA